jgi:hypothetical protein
MTDFLRRGWSPDTPCPEYAKFQRVAEELLANIGETTSLEQFEQAQKGLLFYWEELKKRLDPLHPRFPGGHRCLDECYLEYAMLIRNKHILQKPPQSASPPAPQQPPLTPDQVVNNLRRVAEERKRPRDTYLGNDAPPQENTK